MLFRSLKSWDPHVQDWKAGDPTWKDGKGKGLIGALNYLAGKGVNAFSFLTYNAGGDGDNVWPFITRDDKLHYDCSKLDQWGVVFDVKSEPYTLHDIRKLCLWGTLMAGGAGVEYYFGYALPENDLVCQDFRSRDKSWDYCRIALDFFHDEKIPFAEMTNADAIIGNPKNDNSKFCLAKPGELYLVYLPDGGETSIDLAGATGKFSIQWFNPPEGGKAMAKGAATLDGGGKETLIAPSADDWLAVIAKF